MFFFLICFKTIDSCQLRPSEELIIKSYKVMIRPILEYAPIATLVMSDNSRDKIEKVQRAAVRVATYWPIKTNTATIEC